MIHNKKERFEIAKQILKDKYGIDTDKYKRENLSGICYLLNIVVRYKKD